MCALRRVGTGTRRRACRLSKPSREIENGWGQANSAIRLALGLLESGSYSDALEEAKRGVEIVRREHIPPLLILNLTVMGNVYRALFAVASALATHRSLTNDRGDGPPAVLRGDTERSFSDAQC